MISVLGGQSTADVEMASRMDNNKSPMANVANKVAAFGGKREEIISQIAEHILRERNNNKLLH